MHFDRGITSIARRRLPLVLLGNAALRIAGGASGVLAGLYLADLAAHGAHVNAALAGTLGAASFAAEVLGAVPMGLLADRWAPRVLMAGGAIFGAAGVQLFAISGLAGVFLLGRIVEGFGVSAGAPALLAHLTDLSDGHPGLRARVMSYFELSLLAGFALGGLLGSQLWRFLHTAAFSVVAALYLACAALLYFGAPGSRRRDTQEVFGGAMRALREPSLRRLAPIWVCVNAIIGLWLGPTVIFLLTGKPYEGQFLTGLFASQPGNVGWLLFGYALIFGAGVAVWSVALPHIPIKRALRISLVGMIGACVGLILFNHSTGALAEWRGLIGVVTALCIMVESGFTPAALSLLAGIVGARGARGTTMGIYSMLLGVGAILGSLLAAALGQWFAVDGLIYGTLAMAIAAIGLLGRLGPLGLQADKHAHGYE